MSKEIKFSKNIAAHHITKGPVLHTYIHNCPLQPFSQDY